MSYGNPVNLTRSGTLKYASKLATMAQFGALKTKYSHNPAIQQLTKDLFIGDCSAFIEKVLTETHPAALEEIRAFTKATINETPQRLFVRDFRNFLSPLGRDKTSTNWENVNLPYINSGDMVFYKKYTSNHSLIIEEKIGRNKFRVIHSSSFGKDSRPSIKRDVFFFDDNFDSVFREDIRRTEPISLINAGRLKLAPSL
jgi:hypothetical protein